MIKITQWITPQRKAVSVTYVISPGPVLTRPGMAGMKTLEGRAADPRRSLIWCCLSHLKKGILSTARIL